MKNSDAARMLPTASYGIAPVSAGGDILRAAIASADAALYEAKVRARNQWILATASDA